LSSRACFGAMRGAVCVEGSAGGSRIAAGHQRPYLDAPGGPGAVRSCAPNIPQPILPPGLRAAFATGHVLFQDAAIALLCGRD
jgi:hypothetical protein